MFLLLPKPDTRLVDFDMLMSESTKNLIDSVDRELVKRPSNEEAVATEATESNPSSDSSENDTSIKFKLSKVHKIVNQSFMILSKFVCIILINTHKEATW